MAFKKNGEVGKIAVRKDGSKSEKWGGYREKSGRKKDILLEYANDLKTRSIYCDSDEFDAIKEFLWRYRILKMLRNFQPPLGFKELTAEPGSFGYIGGRFDWENDYDKAKMLDIEETIEPNPLTKDFLLDCMDKCIQN